MGVEPQKVHSGSFRGTFKTLTAKNIRQEIFDNQLIYSSVSAYTAYFFAFRTGSLR